MVIVPLAASASYLGSADIQVVFILRLFYEIYQIRDKNASFTSFAILQKLKMQSQPIFIL